MERPPSVWEVMGSIHVRDSNVFFVPRSCHVDQFPFHLTFRKQAYELKVHSLFIYQKQELSSDEHDGGLLTSEPGLLPFFQSVYFCV